MLATVNNVPINEADLRLRSLTAGGHQPRQGEQGGEEPTLTPAQRKNVLETIVREELIAQRADELGLARDPAFQEELRRQQAALDAFRRQRLNDLFHRHEREQARVGDAEARRYFDANAETLRTELHIWQILLHDETRIEQAHRDLVAGAAFEEVARRPFSTLPETARVPWDLGYLKWLQLPEPWHEALRPLQPGQTTSVVRGPRNRFWILKLIDRRRDPEMTYERARPNILETLRAQRIEASRAQAERELRRKARIVYARPAKAAGR